MPLRCPGVNRQKPSCCPSTAPVLVDDVAGARLEAVPAEERAVVVAREEARLLALGPARDLEAGALGLARASSPCPARRAGTRCGRGAPGRARASM